MLFSFVLLVLGLIVTFFLVSWAYHFHKIPANHNRTVRRAAELLGSYPTRISITASTGSGKTTLSKQLSALLEIPHYEMDSFFHGPNWTPKEMFVSSVHDALKIDEATGDLIDPKNTYWIVDGNYSAVRANIMKNATVIIWLDYHSHVVYPRLAKRILRRSILQEELWNGNKESLWTHFCTKDSLFLWLWKGHAKRKIEYSTTLLGKPNVIHLVSPEQTRQLLNSLHRLAK